MNNYQLENFKEVLKSCFNPIEGYSNFSDYLFDYLTYNYPDIAFRFEEQADLVAAILDDLAYLYDVYFSEFGFYRKTYIITLNGRSKANIYKDLKLDDEGILYPEFVKGIHKVNTDGQLIESKQTKIKYFYKGPVYKFNKLYQDIWTGETYAVSDKQALNQLTFQFKESGGWNKNTAFTLDINYLSKNESQIILPDDYIPNITKRCEKCGTKLTDGGYCPVCDDGDEEALNEDIEKHEELNPLLFENDELKDDVKEAIEKIAKEFVKELKADKIKFYLEDIVLVGSNVSYNYTKDSDLDIHLIASSDELKCPDNLYPLLYSAYRSIFNKNYDLNIKGIPAEIYIEMDKPTGKSNGIYSIYNGWLKHPVQEDIPDIDQESFDKLFTKWEDKYFELEHNIMDEKIIDKFIEDLYDLRKDSIANDGEYGLGNLVFKEFRNLGYLDHLKEIKRKEIEKDLSLEALNK